jgi:ketosteroid isomerase-like protein
MPESFARAFAAIFNTQSLDRLLTLYTGHSVLNLGGGTLLKGQDQIRAGLANFLAPQLPMIVSPRFQTVSGETAVVAFDWSIDGTASDGRQVHLKGRAIDVIRRDSDGVWRQLLDQPFGGDTVPA